MTEKQKVFSFFALIQSLKPLGLWHKKERTFCHFSVGK